MDSVKKNQIATVVGAALLIIGLILCSFRATEIISHKIVDAKILSVEEFSAECRRVSGKYGTCIDANVEVEFPINKAGELRKGRILVEHVGEKVTPGKTIKVMFVEKNPDGAGLMRIRLEGRELSLAIEAAVQLLVTN